ncbi:SseB family protein [Oenococcus sp.]|uniref:SseB family protein n=1 Tax=Oenococcus sp. TaxID=1979414 RepID=UPI0039E7B736
MSQWIKTIEYFVGQDDQTPNIAVIEINHPEDDPDGRQLDKLLEDSQLFSPFNDETKKYDRFLTMTMAEDFFAQVGLEVFSRLSSDPVYDVVIFFDTTIKGFLPVPTAQLAQFVQQAMAKDQENSDLTVQQPSHEALNRFYKLQTKDTEKIENPALQTTLDADQLDDTNINSLLSNAVFLMPTRIKKRRIRQEKIDFFLLSQQDQPQVSYLPIFSDWDHLAQWYFSASANGYNEDDNAEIIAVPAEGLKEIRGNIGDAVSNIVLNPTTNDFILDLSDSNQKDDA